jgi:hypothetical protein
MPASEAQAFALTFSTICPAAPKFLRIFLPNYFGIIPGIPIFATPIQTGVVGAVAQLVEQWTENPCVGGSTPPHTTLKGHRNVTFLFATY